MLKPHEQIRVQELLDKGFSVAEVAQRTGRSLGTIYKYRRVGSLQKTKTAERTTYGEQIAPFVDMLDEHVRRGTIKPTALYFLLQQQGYKGSRATFDRYYQSRKHELHPKRLLTHVETEPGEQAQVDWGHFGEITIGGKREKVYLFAYILSWSRAIYMEFVVRQNQRTLQACHRNAFDKLGIPRTIVYDNMKTVVSRRERLPDGSKLVHYNQNFVEFARYYKFEPIACPPYYPQAKGKIEASIKYARHFFSRVTPKLNVTLEELNERLDEWIETHAHQRVHGTTHEKPYDRWVEEQKVLGSTEGVPPFNPATFRSHFTTQYGLLTHNGTTYNLGPDFARLKLDVREVQDYGLPQLEIYRNNELLSVVTVPSKKHSWVSVKMPTIAAEEQEMKDTEPVKRVRKTKRRYDISVEQPDLDRYNVQLIPQSVVSHG